MKGKVQTNNLGNNILVEMAGGSYSHMSHLDFPVEFEKLTDEEIVAEYNTLIGSPTIDVMKDALMAIKGFAKSAIHESDVKINTNDLVKYSKT